MIDLHLHTTASDGLLTPGELVARAASAGLTIISVTDHDTVAGIGAAATAGAECGVRVVPGIEITAVENGRDVHVLGYFVDIASTALAGFLSRQRADRVRRTSEIGSRLGELGFAIDVDRLLAAAHEGSRTIGRPAIADALVAAGHVADRNAAFATLLGRGQRAFIPRRGIPGAEVIATIHAAGGIASLAHPGVMEDDGLIAPLAAAGLDALEVWHSDHSPAQQRHYFQLAQLLGLARSGGSDYHGDGVHRACRLGATLLPPEEFARLEAAAGTAP